MRKLLTERLARGATGGEKLIEIRDTAIPGFALRVSPGGKRAWTLTWGPRDARRRLPLGVYPWMDAVAARAAAREAVELVQAGKDPTLGRAMPKRKGDAPLTVAGLAALYVENYAKRRKRSWREDQRLLDLYIVPAWGARPAADVTRADVRRLVERIAADKPVQANRVLALVSKLFGWAVLADHVPANPAYRIPKPGAERRGDRVLTAREIRAVWQACEADRSPLARIYQLMLLTGQRGGELRRMAYSQVDEAGWWSLPGAATKNKRPHRVYLVPIALELLARCRRRATQAHPFTSRRWKLGERPSANSQKVFARIAARAALAAPWTAHDLRRTAATRLAQLGTTRHVIRRVLNHADSSVTAVYDLHSYDREVRAALEALAAELARIVSSAPSAPG